MIRTRRCTGRAFATFDRSLGRDNLIGHKATIIGNVRIGKGCIVGAGSVVTKDLPPNTICCGVPARPIRDRFPAPTPCITNA